MTYSLLFAVLWPVWIVSWTVGAVWASRPAARPPAREELLYWVLTVVGVVLLSLNFRNSPMTMVWTTPDAKELVLFAIAAAGLAFTWWARLHLGTLWSGRVTRKADHRIIDSGPYGIVRHPIYTGILVAIYATVLLQPGAVRHCRRGAADGVVCGQAPARGTVPEAGTGCRGL